MHTELIYVREGEREKERQKKKGKHNKARVRRIVIKKKVYPCYSTIMLSIVIIICFTHPPVAPSICSLKPDGAQIIAHP